MARSAQRPPRRLILGLLFLSLSVLTALSLPGLEFARGSGPFAQFWVRAWVGLFGLPAVWLIVATGLVWGCALLLRWPRGFLWGLSLLLWPFLIASDAFLLALRLPPGAWLLPGRLGWAWYDRVSLFFGSGAGVQVTLALGTVALATAILVVRWGLPRVVSRILGRALAAATRATVRAILFGARLLGRFLRWLLLALLWPLAQVCWRGAIWLGRGGVILADRGVAALRAAALRPAAANAGAPRPSARAGMLLSGGPAAAPRAVAQGEREPLSEAETAPEEGPAPSGFGLTAGLPPPAPGRGQALAPERPSAMPRAAAPQMEMLSAEPEPRARRRRPRRESPATASERAIATLDLLEETVYSSPVTQEEIRATAARLRETLASFGIDGQVGEVHPGPVITQYEFMPGVGVTINQITSRQDDLALALRAHRVRLVAPIPGKAAVGVEIPNHEPALISFKEIASRGEFRDARSPLALALGKDVAGRPFYASLDSMPHLLVAGTTGSGKSVCLNTLIASLLLRRDPTELRLLLIDPKMLELTVYNGIPHLLKPVLTDSRESARALQWLTREMERRYRVFARLGMRNIEAYRKRAAAATEEEGEETETMPYIVVFVDELADLMMSNQSEVELPVARLAQMARAVGIHLVLATQRPSVDVITGVIKANFPARIAFQVASRTDSRTILDMNGAESLIGRGDMLFIPPGKAQAHRVHGAFISDSEIESVAAYLRQFPPAEELTAAMKAEEEMAAQEDLDDPLYHEALRIVVGSQQGSTSFLQRRLRVGYTRAGRLMDMLEREGVVGPPDGSRAREVLVRPDQLSRQELKEEKSSE